MSHVRVFAPTHAYIVHLRTHTSFPHSLESGRGSPPAPPLLVVISDDVVVGRVLSGKNNREALGSAGLA